MFCIACLGIRFSNIQLSMEVKPKTKSERLNPEEHVCSTCSKSFSWPSLLKRHLYKHTDDRPVTCDICNKSFKGEGQRNKHIQCDSHKRQLKIQNLVESGLKRNAYGLIKTRVQKKRHECKECGEILGSIVLLYEHRETDHESDPKKKVKKCNLCLFASSRVTFLNKHLLKMHGIKDNIFKCDLCGYETDRSSTFIQHQQSKHLNTKLSCDQCEFKARRKDDIQNHKLVAHLGFTFECEQCSYSSSSKKSLETHKCMKHEKISCDLCNGMFYGSNSLSAHRKQEHEGETVNCVKKKTEHYFTIDPMEEGEIIT